MHLVLFFHLFRFIFFNSGKPKMSFSKPPQEVHPEVEKPKYSDGEKKHFLSPFTETVSDDGHLLITARRQQEGFSQCCTSNLQRDMRKSFLNRWPQQTNCDTRARHFNTSLFLTSRFHPNITTPCSNIFFFSFWFIFSPHEAMSTCVFK